MQANVFSQALLGQQSRATLNAPGAIWRNKSFFTNTWSVDDMPRQDGKNFVVTGKRLQLRCYTRTHSY